MGGAGIRFGEDEGEEELIMTPALEGQTLKSVFRQKRFCSDDSLVLMLHL